MVMTAKQLGTHFVDLKDGWYKCFEIEICDKCGCNAEAANPININKNPARMGLKEVPEHLPELFWDSDFGGATCGC